MRREFLLLFCCLFFNLLFSNNSFSKNNETAQETDYNSRDSLLVEIGTDSTFYSNFPYYYWYHNSLFETIILSNEINSQGVQNGSLTNISFFYNDNSSLPNQQIKIWIGETDLDFLPEEWISADELSLVYDDVMDIPNYEGELLLEFSDSYIYSGNNLVIMINRPWTYSYGGNLNFLSSSIPENSNRSFCRYSDSIEFDPINPPLDSSYIDRIPNMTLNFIDINLVGVENISITETNKVASLIGNFPNPFNPTTTIKFSVEKEGEIELSMYNIKGQKLKTLTKNYFIRGSYSILWNGDDEFGKSVSSGVYYYKLNVNGNTKAINKCLLLK